MNLRKARFLFVLPLMLAAASVLRAQTGCTDSPEDPTVVLALVGGAGAIATTLTKRWRRRP